MDGEFLQRILNLFQIRIIRISKEYGASEEYIQGQMNEARHQLDLLEKELHRSNLNGF